MDEAVWRAMIESLLLMGRLREGSWVEQREGWLYGITGMPVASGNGAVCWGASVRPDEVLGALEEVRRAQLPFSLALTRAAAHLRDVADQAGLRREDDAVLMRCDDVVEPPAADGLTIRELAPSEAMTHARVAAEGFGAPIELFEDLITPMAGHDAVPMLVGEVDGEPVTTAQGTVLGESVGVFDVATPQAYRGHGYGAAITAALIRLGRESGARWAWLQPSPLARPVYERLGFRAVGSYEFWVSA